MFIDVMTEVRLFENNHLENKVVLAEVLFLLLFLFFYVVMKSYESIYNSFCLSIEMHYTRAIAEKY